MCTVLAYFGTDLSREEFETYLARTQERGPDDSKTVVLPQGGFLGFQRLAIMGLSPEGMQPFQLGNSWVRLSQDEAGAGGKRLLVSEWIGL